MKQWDFKTVSICLTMAVSAVLWFNSSINGVRSDIVESQYQTAKDIGELRGEVGEVRVKVVEVRVEVAESESRTTKAIAESESKTTKAIGEVQTGLGVLNARVDSLEEKVEGVIEHLRNRDAQTAPKDTSTLDLEETSP